LDSAKADAQDNKGKELEGTPKDTTHNVYRHSKAAPPDAQPALLNFQNRLRF
jgi:hypothetical protein